MIHLDKPLPDKDGDGKVTLGKDWAAKLRAQDPSIKTGDVLTLVEGSAFDYLVRDEQLPASPTADPWDWQVELPRGPLTFVTGSAKSIIPGWGDGELRGQHWGQVGAGIQVTEARDKLHIADLRIDEAKRVLYQAARLATIREGLIERVDVGSFSEIAFLVRGDSVVDFRNIRLRGSPVEAVNGNYRTGIQVGSKAGEDDTQTFSATVGMDLIEIIGVRGDWTEYKTEVDPTDPQKKRRWIDPVTGQPVALKKHYTNVGGAVVEGNNKIRIGRMRITDCSGDALDCKSQVEIDMLDVQRSETAVKLWADALVHRSRTVDPTRYSPGLNVQCGLMLQGASPDFLKANPGSKVPVYRLLDHEFVGPHPKHVCGRAGALMDVVLSSNLPSAEIVTAYAGKGMNLWNNGEQLMRRTL